MLKRTSWLLLLILAGCAKPGPTYDIPTMNNHQLRNYKCRFIGVTQGFSDEGLTLSWSVDRAIALNQMRRVAKLRGGNALRVEWLGCMGGQADIYYCRVLDEQLLHTDHEKPNHNRRSN